MLGAILGDIAGAPYEFRPPRTKEFELFLGGRYTDDTVLTIAIAESFLRKTGYVENLHKWFHKYPRAGYGGKFRRWCLRSETEPYGSYANGSAMRVSPVAYVANSIEECLELACASAKVTHNHPDAIAGAQATAAAIYMARTGSSQAEIGKFITKRFGYDLNRTVSDIRTNYRNSVSCKKTVPESIVAFLESNSYEETIRNAIWIGGDADTMAAIAGSIAEPFWGIPTEVKTKGLEKLPVDLRSVLDEFYREYKIDC